MQVKNILFIRHLVPLVPAVANMQHGENNVAVNVQIKDQKSIYVLEPVWLAWSGTPYGLREVVTAT